MTFAYLTAFQTKTAPMGRPSGVQAMIANLNPRGS